VKAFLDANLLIYLNTTSERTRGIYDDFYTELAANNRLYTDVLILDELLYISRKRYNVPYSVTTSFIDDVVLQFTEVLPLGLSEHQTSQELLRETHLKPSDALHVASMILNSVTLIASEDRELDGVSKIRRIWLHDPPTTHRQ
jgi:predicted nucleic acid-binding protein